MKHDPDESLTIGLTRAEAIVLFEWLTKHDGALPIDDAAEQDVLWRVEARLEKILAEPLCANYNEILAAARAHVRVRNG